MSYLFIYKLFLIDQKQATTETTQFAFKMAVYCAFIPH